MAFFVALDVNGTRQATSETMLSPAPTIVRYPGPMHGTKLETADGQLIIQQPTRDNRTREWVWQNYPGFLAQYEKQYQRLLGLRSRVRFQQGLSPHIWVKDTSTKLLRRLATTSGTTTSPSGASTLIDTAANFTTEYVGGVVEVTQASYQQERQILSVTSTTQLTVDTWGVAPPSGATYVTRRWVDDWFRARVIEVFRETDDRSGNVRYQQTVFTFVIDDPAFNALG